MTEKRENRFHLLHQDDHYTIVDGPSDPFFPLSINGDTDKLPVDELAAWLREQGFTAIGTHGPGALHEAMPFYAGGDIVPVSYWQAAEDINFLDVFDPAVQAAMDDRVRQLCEAHRDNPNLIGYIWTDTPLLVSALARDKFGTDWVSALRTAEPDTPGRVAYEEYLLFRYHAAYDEFARIYQMRIEDFLTEPVVYWDHPQVLADDMDFMRRIAAEYYRVVGEANRRYDPDHLIFGDCYWLFEYADAILEVASQYMDVLTVRPDANLVEITELQRLHELLEKPVMLVDQQPADLDDKRLGQRYADVLARVAELPFVVGYEYAPLDGLFDEDGTPRDILLSHIASANRELPKSR